MHVMVMENQLPAARRGGCAALFKPEDVTGQVRNAAGGAGRIAELKAVVQAEAEPVGGHQRALRHALSLRLQRPLLGAHPGEGLRCWNSPTPAKTVGLYDAASY
ncbi:MAG: hypothetical protein IPL64_04380 [Flavobacteriales bacterium]|nr:hypothetical protein [Flavobacteriales bacterium]